MIATEASEAEYIYIKNPYEKVELNRVVKEWEWVCLQVGISSFTRKESGYKCKERICYGQTFFSKWNSLSPYIDTSKRVL